MLAPVQDLMSDADLAVANLETVVTECGTPSDKAFNFRTSPQAFVALRSAGIDVVSMANNHGMDFGLEGLEDSLRYAKEANFPIMGIGQNADEAYRPFSTEINGQRIAIVAATQTLDNALIKSWTATDTQPGLASAKEEQRLIQAIKQARSSHDTVIVFLHWGVEGQTCPSPNQTDLSTKLVDAGADVIVGGHAHRVQGGGFKGRSYVHYGLGNFVFNAPSPSGFGSGVLFLTIDGRDVQSESWVPARLKDGVATKLEGSEADTALDQWSKQRDCTDLTSKSAPSS